MTLDTNVFTTFDAIGNREDLTNMIYRVEAEDTPFVSAAPKVRATAVLHEWQTQALDTANPANAQLEGDVVVVTAATPTVRLNNTCQISRRDVGVSGTEEAVNSAGRESEMAYQKMLKGIELKRDIEAACLSVNVQNNGSTTVARTARSATNWYTTNTNLGATGSNSTGPTDARNDGTQRALDETLVKDVVQKIYTAGGNPDRIMVGAPDKQIISGFTGRASSREIVSENKILAAASIYASDFGDLTVVPNRHQRSRDCHIYQVRFWGFAALRSYRWYDLARTSDAEKGFLITEWTLEARNERSSGLVADTGG